MTQVISMTTIADGQEANATNLNAPSNDLKTAIEATLNGTQAFDSVQLQEQASVGSTPASGFGKIVALTDGTLHFVDDTGTDTDLTAGGGGGGDTLPVDDTTSLVQDPADNTKEMRIDVGGVTTGTVRVATMPDSDITLVGTDAPQTLTNKTIDADNNTVSNIGSAEIKADIITGLTADASPDGAADYVMTYDDSDTAIKKVLLGNLPSGGGLYTSLAILSDTKSSGTDGGTSSSATWNARDLQTEDYDPDNIVTIASNKFTPVSDDYRIKAEATSFGSSRTRIRLYNVTTSSVEILGISTYANGSNVAPPSVLVGKFTANGTDEYRIDHYTQTGKTTNGLGVASSAGTEVYLTIILETLS